MRIAVVGPCAAGKSVLVEKLRALGYDAHQVSQEHSGVPTMWRMLHPPDVLIYLDASLETISRRRKISWGADYLAELNHRLRHARRHCDLYIRTDGLSEEEVLERVLAFLRQREKRNKAKGP
ncbi:MAG: hypothetical protein N2V78_00530 [Methanophagales archaeon]|nr:hypothetical protein [Methanophagales archaeon]